MTTAKKAAAKKAPAKKVELDTTIPADPDAAGSAPEGTRKTVEKTEAAAKAKLGSAAERRGDYLRALEEELDMCQRSGKESRVRDVKAEIQRVKSVKGRNTPPSDEA